MKVIHVYGSISRMHGATKWVMAFASELKNREHHSDVLCTEFQIPKPYWLTAGIKTANDDAKPNFSEDTRQRGRIGKVLRNYTRVLTLIRYLPPDADVVVLHTEATVPLMPFVKLKCRRAKIIYYCYQPPREVYDLWDVVKQDIGPLARTGLRVALPFYKWIDRILVQKVDSVLVWSPEYRAYAQAIYGDLNYALVPAGVDFRMFDLPEAKVAQKMNSLRTDCDYLLLMNASLTRKKNVDIFVRLLASLNKDGLKVRGVVIGEGPLQPELKTLAAQLGVSHCLTLTGYVSQEDLPYFYYAADILYYLEPNGAWTMSVIEAGAARKPVIVAAGGSMPTLVRDGETGFILSDLQNLDELHAKSTLLLKNSQMRMNVGQQNYEHCKQFSLQQSADNFLEALVRLG